jgi:hypothetical protein
MAASSEQRQAISSGAQLELAAAAVMQGIYRELSAQNNAGSKQQTMETNRARW